MWLCMSVGVGTGVGAWCCKWVESWSLASWQQLKTYQDRHRLMAVRIHGDFVVLPQWETMCECICVEGCGSAIV